MAGRQTKVISIEDKNISLGLNSLPLDQINSDSIIAQAYEYWQRQCRGRGFPERSDITPRGLKPLLRYAALIAVIDGGADYEYRIVGDACVQAHGYSPQGARWSALDTSGSADAKTCRKIYEAVVKTGRPVAAAGFIARKFFAPGYENDVVYCTLICLPLGSADKGVEYILSFAHYHFDIAAAHQQPPKS